MYKEELRSTLSVWKNMMKRCYRPNREDYQNYGKRGIIVCDRWHKFKNFVEDMGIRPPDHSIERDNNDGNYEPGNCRWATDEEQRLNKRPGKGYSIFYHTEKKKWALKIAGKYVGYFPTEEGAVKSLQERLGPVVN